MKKVYILVVLLFLLANFATAQNGVVTTTVTLVTSSSVDDKCTHELVDYAGGIQLVTDAWVDANGATHVRSRTSQLNVQGVGKISGYDYVVQSGDTLEMTSTDQLPFDLTQIDRFALIGKGPVPNERLLMVFHLTVNLDLTTTSEVQQMLSICK
jgi:hypothetical protein